MSTQPPSIDMPSVADMLTSVFATLPGEPQRNADEVTHAQQAAAATLVALMPADALEAEMAVRIVAAHFAAMDCFRRAALPEVPDAMAIRLRGNAMGLSRMAERMTAALERRQGTDRAALSPAAKGRDEGWLKGRPQGAHGNQPSPASQTEPPTVQFSAQHPIPSESTPPEPATPSPPLSRHERRRVAKQAARAARLAGPRQARDGQQGVAAPG
jgi:hypothetical protein